MVTPIIASAADPDAWINLDAILPFLTVAYLTVLGLVSIYGLHRYWLVYLYYRHRRRLPRPSSRFAQLPVVTVQLPMFNEARVAERVIDAACALKYPRHLLQVQVLDDSTNESGPIARARVNYWAAQGYDIQYIHRSNRHGYKAGALENGLKSARGEFIAIFDADFVPEPNFLKRTIHYFTDPTIGMVQTRWGHLNRDSSLLTRSQAIFLDGHFVIEHTARNRADRWINFNGTAGLWRKTAIAAAGGWQHDTLTEDVDLSYRAQLCGWRFAYVPRVCCPAELPPEINAFKSQQHRWTKGSIQTAKKLLPRLLTAKIPLRVKIEAFFHLTAPMCYLYITLMALLFYPAICLNMQLGENGTWTRMILGCSLFALGTVSGSVFYIASQRVQRRGFWSTVIHLPLLMSIGIGIAINNARGCLEALFGHDSPFVVTPKYNTTQPGGRHKGVIPTPTIKVWMSLIELGMGLYMSNCVYLACVPAPGVEDPGFLGRASVPFLAIFAIGYLYVGFTSLWGQFSLPRAARVAPAA